MNNWNRQLLLSFISVSSIFWKRLKLIIAGGYETVGTFW